MLEDAPRRSGVFTGTGSLVSYPFTFKVVEVGDVVVIRTPSGGSAAALTYGSTCLITLNADQDNDPGGSVQYAVAGTATALPSGDTLFITGFGIPFSQVADLPQPANFTPTTVENALDRMTMLAQVLRDMLLSVLGLNPLTDDMRDAILVAFDGYALLNGGNAFTGVQRVAWESVAYASTITLDGSISNNYRIGALTGNITLANPSNLKAGAVYNIKLKQDGTGGRTVAFGNKWRIAGNNDMPTAANARALLVAIYDESEDLLLGTLTPEFVAP